MHDENDNFRNKNKYTNEFFKPSFNVEKKVLK